MECSLLFGQPHYSHCTGLSQSCKVMNTLHKMLHLYDNLVTTLQGKQVDIPISKNQALQILYLKHLSFIYNPSQLFF